MYNADDFNLREEHPVGKILSFIYVTETNSLWCATEKNIVVWSLNGQKIINTFHTNGCSTLTEAGTMIWCNSLKEPTIYIYDGKSNGERSYTIEHPKNTNITVLQSVDNYIWGSSGNHLLIW